MTTVQETYDKLKKVYEEKNHDYGNSFDESLDEWGLVAALVRMGDKFKRLKTLWKKPSKAKVKESLVDTLLDLANYAVMTAVYIMNKQQSKRQIKHVTRRRIKRYVKSLQC